MLIYNGTKREFMRDVESETLETKLYEAIREKMGRATGASELRSWKNSLQAMYFAVNENALPDDTGIAIGYNIPQTSKRVDFIDSGHDESHKANIIIVELKQWEKIQPVDGQGYVVETYIGGANRRVVHPCHQAWSYATLIRSFNTATSSFTPVPTCTTIGARNERPTGRRSVQGPA